MVEVNVSTDNGETWKALELRRRSRPAELRRTLRQPQRLQRMGPHLYRPADYVGKKVKLAFRYYGRPTTLPSTT